MTTQRYKTVLLALCCVSALGVTATTLDSSLSTNPDEVIDFDYQYLPIGQDSVKKVKRESLSNQGGGSSSSSETQPDSGWLLDLLRALLTLLLLLAALGLAYRYRERLRALGHVVKRWVTDGETAGGSDPRTDWPNRPLPDDVHRAWVRMVRRADVDRPWLRTPAECAQAAVEAGLNAEAVTRITTSFEEVRYGDASPTAARERAARKWFQQLDDYDEANT